MPAPIMLAMTMLVSGKSPSLRSSPFAGASGVMFSSFFAGLTIQTPRRPLILAAAGRHYYNAREEPPVNSRKKHV